MKKWMKMSYSFKHIQLYLDILQVRVHHLECDIYPYFDIEIHSKTIDTMKPKILEVKKGSNVNNVFWEI